MSDDDIETTYLATVHGERVLCWVEHSRVSPFLFRLDPWPRQSYRTSTQREAAEAAIYGRECACVDGLDCTLEHDYDSARARFSAFTTRCSSCRRLLTDPFSKTVGIGPDCRREMPALYLAHLADLMSHVLAEAAMA